MVIDDFENASVDQKTEITMADKISRDIGQSDETWTSVLLFTERLRRWKDSKTPSRENTDTKVSNIQPAASLGQNDVDA